MRNSPTEIYVFCIEISLKLIFQTWNLCKMNIKIKISVRRVAKGKLKKARFYADFRVSQSPNKIEKRKGEKETWIVQLDRGDWMM